MTWRKKCDEIEAAAEKAAARPWKRSRWTATAFPDRDPPNYTGWAAVVGPKTDIHHHGVATSNDDAAYITIAANNADRLARTLCRLADEEPPVPEAGAMAAMIARLWEESADG